MTFTSLAASLHPDTLVNVDRTFDAWFEMRRKSLPFAGDDISWAWHEMRDAFREGFAVSCVAGVVGARKTPPLPEEKIDAILQFVIDPNRPVSQGEESSV